jgi:hypothetical protein
MDINDNLKNVKTSILRRNGKDQDARKELFRRAMNRELGATVEWDRRVRNLRAKIAKIEKLHAEGHFDVFGASPEDLAKLTQTLKELESAG